MSLSGSETDVNYYLLRNNVRTGAEISPGTGGVITFGGLSLGGSYTVEAERNGCVRVMSGYLQIQATPQQFILSANKSSYCSGVANTGVELSLSGSQSNHTYQLQRDNGGGYVDYGDEVSGTGFALTPAWQNVPEGTYRVVARTSAGCTNNMTGRPIIIETVPPSATITTSNPNSRCVGSSVDFYINVSLSGAQPYNFDIVNNIGEPVISESNYYSDTYSVQVNPASNVTYTLTNLTDASSCESETNVGQVQFFVRPLPVFNFDSSPNSIGDVGGISSTSICSGSPVTLEMNVSNTSGPYEYSWSHGLGNTRDVTFTPNQTRTYDAKVRNEYGCQDTKPVEVVVNPLPVIDFNLSTGSNEVCENEGTVTLIPVAPNTGGTFSGPGVTGNFFNPAIAGASLIPHNISYTFQNTATGCASTITKPVIVHPEPNVSVLGNQTNFCADQLTGTLRGTPQNSNGSWLLAAGARPWFSDNGNGSATINITGALTDAGERSYTADYIYTDPTTGCVSDGNYLTFNVRSDLSDNVDFRLSGGGAIPATLCQDDVDINLEAFFVNSGAVIADGTFSGPGITDNGNGTAIFSPDDAGTGIHIINYNYTDPVTQCTGSASHSIQIGTTLTLHGLNPIYCKEDAAFQIYGDPGPGTLEIFFETEIIARFIQSNNSSTNQFTITPSADDWESGAYRAVYTHSHDGCDNVIEYEFTIRDALDATFTVEDDQDQFCVTQNSDPYNYRIELTPNQKGGTFTINTASGNGVEPNGKSFYPDLAGPGTHEITYTINTGACFASKSIFVNVIPVPTLDFTNLNDTYCENESDFEIIVSNTSELKPPLSDLKFSFSSTANIAGRVPIYLSSKGDLNIDKKSDNEEVFFSPSYAGVGTYFITYTYDNSDNMGCEVTVTKTVEILEAPKVNFGVHDPVSGGTTFTDPLKFCQNADPVYLRGNIFTNPNDVTIIGSGYFTGVGIDNDAHFTSGTDGYALFDPSLVSVGDDHSIKYTYTHYNGCKTEHTKSYDILPAPTTHYKVVSDPANGIYCFDGASPAPADYGVEIGLEYSQPDVTYHLWRNGAPVTPGQTVDGATDGSAVKFPDRVTAPGTYTVQAVLKSGTPSSACSDMMDGSVEVRMNFVVGSIYELIDESCDGLKDGSLKISAHGGTAPYKYIINDGTDDYESDSGEFSNLAPGDYSITITDKVGCEWKSASDSKIKQGTNLDLASSSIVQLTCNGVNNASFTVKGTGSMSGSYEFRRDPSSPWVSNNSNTYTFKDLAAGIYQVDVRDPHNTGCHATESVTINPEPAAITLVSAPDLIHIGCSESPIGEIMLEAERGGISEAFHYVLYELKPWGDWVPIESEDNEPSAVTFDELYGGEYRIDITDVNGCPPLEVPVTINAAASKPVVQLAGDGIVHEIPPTKGSIEIGITGGLAPYAIEWSGVAKDGVTVIAGLDDDVYKQTGLSAGTYKVVVTDDNDCEATLESLEVEKNPDFKITYIKENPSGCYGSDNGEISLVVKGGLMPYKSITLKNSAGDVIVPATSGSSFANYKNLPADNYEAVVTDDRGISVSESITLEGPAAPLQLTFNKTADAKCFGDKGTIKFSATGGTPFDPVAPATENYYEYKII